MHTLEHTMGSLSWTTRVVETPGDLEVFREWVEARVMANDVVGVDTEGTGLDLFSSDFRLRLAQFGTADEAWLVPAEYGQVFAETVADAIRVLPRMVLHNAPFDALVFDTALGVSIEEVMPKMLDTQIYAHLLDSRKDYEGGTGHTLKALSAHYVDSGAQDGQFELRMEFRRIGHTIDTGWRHIPLVNPVYQYYSASDVILVSRLLPRLQDLCREADVPQELIDYEHRISRIGATIRRKGMRLDVGYTRRLIRELKGEEVTYTDVAARYGVTSVNATTQVAEALLAMGETLTEKTGTGRLSVGKDVLLPLADLDSSWERIGAREPNLLADAVLRAKRAGKWRTAYAEALRDGRDANDRVHPSINTLGAITARWSVSDPALQQLPSGDWRIRRCVVAEDGQSLGSSDFAQVELRVLVALAGAESIVAQVNDGLDVHTATTRVLYGIGDDVSDADLKEDIRRKRTKIVSLGKAYAGGPTALAKQTGLPVEQVKKAIDAYDAAMPEIKRYGKLLEARARRTWETDTGTNRIVQKPQYTIRTPIGRLLRLDRDRTYKAVAYMCQSAARDVLGEALCRAEDAGILPYIVGVIHDEVLVEAPHDKIDEVVRILGECMTTEYYGCQITADPEVVGSTWALAYRMPPEEAP